MANPYYNHGSVPTQGAPGASAPIRGEYDLLAAAFDKLPVLAANANKMVVVNAAATALTVGVGVPTSAVTGDLLVATATDTIGRLAAVAAGSYLRSAGVATLPVWSTLILPNAATANRIVFATALNTWGESANLAYDGTYFLTPALAVDTVNLDQTNKDTILARDAAFTLALKNVANAMTLRVYGTTTGPKYVTLKHDGTDATLDTAAASGKLILGGNASDIQWGKALVALGGGAAATLGTIGGSGPAAAGQNTWMQLKDSAGVTFWVPAWK